VKSAATLVLVMLAMSASAAVDARALAHEGSKTQWAPTRNFSSLNARAVFAGESRGATSPYAGEAWETAAGEKDWQYAAGNPTRYTDPDGRCLPGMGLAECVTFDTALVGSYAKRRQELGLKMGADIFLGPVRAAEELAKCATEPTLSNCKAFRFTIGMDPSEKEELAKLFAQSAGWEDFKTGLNDRNPVLMGRGFASMQYEFEQFANIVAGTAAGALGELPSAPPVQVRAPVPNAPPVNKGLLLQRRIRLTAGGVNSPSKEAAKRAADIRLPRGSHLQKDPRADQARAAASEPPVAPSSAGSPAAYRRYEDLEHLKLTDRMSPQRMDAHVESVAQSGFENPVINYVVIDGENYVVWGNNRVTAARRLGRTGELLFEEVKLGLDRLLSKGALAEEGEGRSRRRA
jgi:hypothetical protein